MKINQWFLLLIAGMASLTGLAVKTQRYNPQYASGEGPGDAALPRFMAAHGWQIVPGSEQPYPFVYTTFAKDGCPRRLVVAELGNASEFADDVKLALGPDLAFVARGAAGDARPDSWSGRLAGWVGGRALLAVSPAPGDIEGACAGPTRAQWAAP
jgi:hypothetical protein